MTRIDPDRHKAERRKTLPRTPCNTAGVLSPDLPAQFRKSSQRTIATHSTSGSTNSPSPPLRRRFVEELRLNGTPTTTTTTSSYFIPGITAKARCLAISTSNSGNNSHSSSNSNSYTSSNSNNNNNCKSEPEKRNQGKTVPTVPIISTSPTRRPIQKPSNNVSAAVRRCSVAASKASTSSGQSSMKSHDSYLSTHSRRSNSSNASNSSSSTPEELEGAMQLYESVVTSIQARRTQIEDDEVLLDELDYQRMLMELQKDAKNGLSSDLGEDYSLRDHVDSIRDLLNDYYDRKAKTTNNNSMVNHDSTSSRSALALLERSIASMGVEDLDNNNNNSNNNNNNNSNSRTRWDHQTSVASSNGSLGRLSHEMNDLPRRKSRDKSLRNNKSTHKSKSRTWSSQASSSSSVSLSLSSGGTDIDITEGNEQQEKQSRENLRPLSPPVAPTT